MPADIEEVMKRVESLCDAIRSDRDVIVWASGFAIDNPKFAADLRALLAYVREVEGALEPFAKAWAETYGRDDPADWPPGLDTAPAYPGPCGIMLVLEDYRRAAAIRGEGNG